MNNALYIAATGMQAQQSGLDTIANNLSNLSTPGFKAGNVNFQELMYADPVGRRLPGADTAADMGASTAAHAMGTGVQVGSISRDFTQGTLTQTGSAMDVAIKGNGFLEVVLADGSHAYTRGGTLKLDKDNFLVTAQGYEIKPAIRLPANPTGIVISPSGEVSVTTRNSAQPQVVGQIELAGFNDPSSLKPLGDGLWLPSDAAGKPTYGKPGDASLGSLAQGAVEGSNVNMVNQMVAMMLAQRAYEMSSKVIQTSDELMSLTNNLRR
jgi:flagellar basal-body rod protein FlgG